MNTIKIRTKKELTEKIREYRNDGYNLITLGKMFAELEKDGEIVVIDK